MRVKMADEKQGSVGQPTFVITHPQDASGESQKKPHRLTKKHVLTAVISLAITALVVTAVLVAVKIYTDAHVETLKLQYTMKMKDKENNDVTQDVSSDTNAVEYHIVKDGDEAWILQDFDKEVEVSKVKTDSGVSCYVTALNKSNAQAPKEIPKNAPNPDDDTPTTQLVYRVSETPIKDISFFGKRINKLCDNIPTYWMVPSCDNGESQMPTNSTELESSDRSKRATVCATCRGYYCVCGCCNAVCGRFASSRYTWYYSRGRYYCTYRMYSVSCVVSLARANCYLRGRRYYYPWS